MTADLFALRALPGAEEYMAEAVRLAGAVPDGAPDPGAIRRVGILGAGTMGRGIAMAFAQSGREVVLVDLSDAAREAARGHLEALAERKLRSGRIDEAGQAELMGRFTFAGEIAAFAGADMVVEAVPEILSLKRQVMAEIEAVVGPQALIASNTSTLDVDAIAAALQAPGRFLGTHFFLPAQVNPLLELVPAKATAPETRAAALALAQALGKQAVVAANGFGFIGNRLFVRLYEEAIQLVEEGAWPEEVDAALEGWGMVIGPFRTLDMIGNDVAELISEARADRGGPPAHPRLGTAVFRAGLLGLKSGRGWYLYDAATPKGRPYEEIHALIQRESQAQGLIRRRIGAEEIIGRCITALMTEARDMLAEGRAARGSDIDMVFVTGYGFPAAVGGILRLAEALGDDRVSALEAQYRDSVAREDSVWRRAQQG